MLEQLRAKVDNGGMNIHPQALPNVKLATVPIEKLTEYSLNQDHKTGGDKARVFASALGFTQKNATDLRSQIINSVMTLPAIEKESTRYGRLFAVDIPVTGPTGSGIVRTGWIVEDGENAPRMVTAYVI